MQLLTDEEVAELLKVTRQTVWAWAREMAEFPKPLKLSKGTTRWMRSDVERFVMDRAGRAE
jgi:prophage regulatory protein